LARLHPRFRDRDIRLIGLSLDANPEGVRAFAETLGVEYPLYLVDETTLGRLFASPQFPIPLSLVTDEKGRLIRVLPGWNSATEKAIETLLEK